jgi:hypothetical protein
MTQVESADVQAQAQRGGPIDGKIVGPFGDDPGQTILLALSATIKSACAGERVRRVGGLVSGEMKNLANQAK